MNCSFLFNFNGHRCIKFCILFHHLRNMLSVCIEIFYSTYHTAKIEFSINEGTIKIKDDTGTYVTESSFAAFLKNFCNATTVVTIECSLENLGVSEEPQSELLIYKDPQKFYKFFTKKVCC